MPDMEVGERHRSCKRGAMKHFNYKLICSSQCSIDGTTAEGVQKCNYGGFLCLCRLHTMAARQLLVMGAFLSAREAN